jgi:hypothetical protein
MPRNAHDLLHQTFSRYPGTLRSALEICAASEIPDFEHVKALQESPADFDTYYRGALRELLAPLSISRSALMFRLLLCAGTRFAERDCRIPVREEVLTGLLRGSIGFFLDAVNAHASDGEAMPLEIYAADLNVRSRERDTGGDIAFFFDMSESTREPLIFPVCFQAKRSNPAPGETQSIRRINKSDKIGDHQFVKLKALAGKNWNCAYLFYHNDMDDLLPEPVLPLVKSIDDIASAASELDVDLEENTADLASYVLHLINIGQNAITDLTGLDAAAQALVGKDVDQIVVLSSNPDVARRLKMTVPQLEKQQKPFRAVGVDANRVFAQGSSYANTYTLRAGSLPTP